MRKVILFTAASLPALASTCATDLDCSLNGVCAGGSCACDKPWGGPSCGVLRYAAASPASGKSLFNISDPRNTWNGPIYHDGSDGRFHMYNPVYPHHELLRSTSIMHGVADRVEGPYAWAPATPGAPTAGASNPAFVAFADPHDANATKYTLWAGGHVSVAGSPDGPFAPVSGAFAAYPGGNPAPIFHGGAWYLTNQGTTTIWTTPHLGQQPWTVFAAVNKTVPAGTNPEDPFMWVDARGSWHIVNHAYDTSQYANCSRSTLSTHEFSRDGKEWHMLVPNVEPYGHTVHYDDGSTHTYTTLERPNLHFDSSGQLTHINLAADLDTGDEGCPDRKDHCPAFHVHCACTNCKYYDHAGSIIVALDVSSS